MTMDYHRAWPQIVDSCRGNPGRWGLRPTNFEVGVV